MPIMMIITRWIIFLETQTVMAMIEISIILRM
ncbi:hypothetical protein SORBI_3005G110433 [Sorghum bicolor]|uniref:Uncharacterized protein n=1 Tax=Sorghum bicolor TaxID=4558 RepID=A0A120GUU3_SORBI|nr:hypothetical protein SORBI_3005G110433 [Sorghum bicolor]